MTKDEMKTRISLALKDPILQQGFEIICKENAELRKFRELLAVGSKLNKGLISRNKFLEEESDKYRNMVFDKMEQIDKAVELLNKWIEPKYDREELLYLTEQFLKEE